MYAIIHIRWADNPEMMTCEATLTEPDLESAIQSGLSYAMRSGFFYEMDDEFRNTIEFELRSFKMLKAESPKTDVLFICRAFQASSPQVYTAKVAQGPG